jgi:hypothetical protein
LEVLNQFGCGHIDNRLALKIALCISGYNICPIGEFRNLIFAGFVGMRLAHGRGIIENDIPRRARVGNINPYEGIRYGRRDNIKIPHILNHPALQ